MYDKITSNYSKDYSKDFSERRGNNFFDDHKFKIVEIDRSQDSPQKNNSVSTNGKEFENLKSVVNNTHPAIISCDKKSNIKSANSNAEELFQYKLEEIRNQSIFQLFSTESGLELQKIINSDFDNSHFIKSISLKLMGRKLDGSEIELQSKIVINKDIDELIIVMQETNATFPVISFGDNSDFETNLPYEPERIVLPDENKDIKPVNLEKIKEEIHPQNKDDNYKKEKNKIDLEAFPGNNCGILFALNEEYKIIDASPSVSNILGYGKDELCDNYLTTKMTVEDIMVFHKFLERVLKSNQKEEPVEISLANKDGIYIPFEFNGINYTNSNKNSIIVFAYEVSKWKNQDIELKSLKSEMSNLIEEKISEFKSLTDKLNRENEWRKEAEKELRVKEERLELAIEISDYGLWDYNFVNGQIYCNDNFCSILELDNDGSHTFYWIDFENMIYEPDKTLFYEAFENHISMDTQLFEVEHRVITKKNNIKWVLTRGKIVQRDNEANPLRFIGKLEDITFRKNNEEKMQTALTRGKELNELKSKFVSMLSHEIRNPLSQILSSSEILEMFINEMPDNEKLELIRKIQKSVDHLTEILNDAVNIDNPEILDKEIKLSEFDIVKFCEKLIDEIKVQYEDCASIHFEPENYRIMVSSDINSLQQIIKNLLTNSIKFTPKDKNIFFKIKANEKSLILILVDEGKGIDYFDQPKIFEPFFKGRNSENTIGSGLGLTLVKRTVASLKGNIEFESRPEEGTNFTVTVPIK